MQRTLPRGLVLVLALVVVLAACDLPFGLGRPTTRSLETGAVRTLTQAHSFEISGGYVEAGTRWSIDLQMVRPDTEHVMVSGPDVKLEAILTGNAAYFRGQQFLIQHLSSDPRSQDLARVAGNAWWKGLPRDAPQLPDLTDGTAFGSAFLGPALNQRTDGVAVDGVDAIDLAGPRADVYVAAAAPHQVLRLRLKHGATVDGLAGADLRYGSYDRDFQITAPADVIDFSNLSTLPPDYTVVSVDTSACGSPCVVSAQLKNLGGSQPAIGPSTVSFKMTETVSGTVLGTCKTVVKPDVGYDATTTVGCSINASPGTSTAMVTATVDNPGRG